MNAITTKKAKEKRVLKGYKIKQSVYDKAMRRAKRDKRPLANLIENFVTDYAAS